MIEIIIERWTAFGGQVDYRWSVWRDGKRVEMGGPHRDGATAQNEATGYCRSTLGREADRVTSL